MSCEIKNTNDSLTITKEKFFKYQIRCIHVHIKSQYVNDGTVIVKMFPSVELIFFSISKRQLFPQFLVYFPIK